jgi:transposase
MPRLLQVTLSPEQAAQLRRQLHERDLEPRTRMRLECVRLSDKGLSVPQIAELLEVHQATVREALHRFGTAGFDALPDAPRAGRPPRASRADLDVLEQMLDASAAAGRTWTLPAIADWLARTRGVHLSSSWISVLLHRDGFRYKRTRDHLRHKADPALQQAARDQLEGLRLAAGRWSRADRPVLPG